MITRVITGLLIMVLAIVWVSTAAADKIKKRDTIASLERKTVEVRPGSIILNSTDKAIDNYRAFLDLVSDDPELRAEAMRRLGDLELEATETQQLATNIEGLDYALNDSAVGLFHQLLEA